MKHYIYENDGAGCPSFAGGLAPSSEAISPINGRGKSRQITSLYLKKGIISENAIIDQIINPYLDQRFAPVQPQAVELSKYEVTEAKQEIKKEFDKNPELPSKIVSNIDKIEESVFQNIKNNIAAQAQNIVKKPTQAGHLVSTHDTLSKIGQANSGMGAQQVVKHTMDVANGINKPSKPSMKNESTVLSNISKKLLEETFAPKQQILSHYDRTINTPTRHLKAGEKYNVATKLNQVKGDLQQDRDAIKKLNSMQQSLGN